MLVDLANKLGTPLAKDVDSLRRTLSSAVGKGGSSYSPSTGSSSTSSWRTSSPASSNGSSGGDRWASYSRGSSPAPSSGYGGSGGGNLSTHELGAFKVGC
jgi:hypothetical protein